MENSTGQARLDFSLCQFVTVTKDDLKMSCLCNVSFRESFDVDNMEQEPQARMLLDQMVHLLQEVAQQNPNVVERVKLQHISKNLVCTTNIPKTHYYCWL